VGAAVSLHQARQQSSGNGKISLYFLLSCSALHHFCPHPPGSRSSHLASSLLDYFVGEFGPQLSEGFLTAQVFNFDAKIVTLQRNFVESLAASSLFCYFVQVKDRFEHCLVLIPKPQRKHSLGRRGSLVAHRFWIHSVQFASQPWIRDGPLQAH
jgi:hypothetical protein